ncbi:MAG: potassium-transporting ATPase subunit KdpC [Phycisphaerae bacterium]|nr:potassium-transporting ATPase subunit KdpC [Phycisphaerae bacterium]
MLRPAIVLFVIMTVLSGIIYPLVVTGIAHLFFPWQAEGSLVNRAGQHVLSGGQAAGSALIGQYFDQPWYFWPRPSATSSMPYNAAASGGSNTGPTNPVLIQNVKVRVAALHAADPGNKQPVPVDLVTTSGSGLDPDESIAAAYYQIPRIARLRHIAPAKLKDMVDHYIVGRPLDILGEKTVNVLELNLALDQKYPY